MEKEKITEIVKNVKDKSNKDLITARDLLLIEFDKTKQLIVDLTRHMEIIEEYYTIINKEIKNRIIS